MLSETPHGDGMMRFIERHLPMQTITLCTIELTLSFFIALNLLAPESVDAVYANASLYNAFLLALTVGATSVYIGQRSFTIFMVC